jgi:hypothetical protein
MGVPPLSGSALVLGGDMRFQFYRQSFSAYTLVSFDTPQLAYLIVETPEQRFAQTKARWEVPRDNFPSVAASLGAVFER